jgi:hypothetical protein
MALKIGTANVEVDYIAWQARDRFGENSPPELILGEAKSFGRGDLLKRPDFTKLRILAEKFPGSTLVVSVLRRSFTDAEKVLLTAFVKWCRRPNEDGRPTNRVVLLTGNELFFDFSIDATWKKMSAPHSEYGGFDHTKSLGRLADATQSIYLGLPPHGEEMRRRRQQRLARKSFLEG